MITCSIDVTQLDKARFKEVVRQNGKKAVFCELVLIETPNGKYGDWMVKQGLSKEDREAGVQLPILGNGKNAGPRRAAPSQIPVDDSAPPPF